MSDPPSAPAEPSPPPKVIDPVWRRRLLLVDAVLIAVLGWLLYSVHEGKQAWDEAEAAQRAERDAANLRGYRAAPPEPD